MPDYGVTFLREDSSFIPDNYVVIYSSYTANALDSQRNDSYRVNVFARFGNSEGERISRGKLKIDGQVIQPGADNLYQFIYSDMLYNEGRSLFGKQIIIEAEGTGQTDSLNAVLTVPLELIPPTVFNFPTSIIEKNSNLRLSWIPDPNNEFHKVQVQVTYYRELSQYNAAGMPNAVESIVYTIPDNGFFTIPQADLNRFPVGAYVQLSIARGSTNNTGNMSALAVVEAHSIPLKVVADMALLTADFTIGTNRTNPCSFRAVAKVNGGMPSYSYTWSIYTQGNPAPVEIGYNSSVTGTGHCSGTSGNNIVAPPGDEDTYITLQVTDSKGNTAIVTKQLVFGYLEDQE